MPRLDLTRRLDATRRFFGIETMTPAQRVTLTELMNLDDRQLADIGLTRATARRAALNGPANAVPGDCRAVAV